MDISKNIPEKLSGPRTYFSIIDSYNPNINENWSHYKKEVDRTLKILLLTKETIVIAGSALCDKKTFDFFTDDKYKSHLFSKGIIKPAFRSEFSNFNQLYLDKTQRSNTEYSSEVDSFYSNCITEIIQWDLENNSRWFANRIEDQLMKQDSFINEIIKNGDQRDIFFRETNTELSKSSIQGEYFNRERYLRKLKNGLSRKYFHAISPFINLLYYISGSRVVNCENYIHDEILFYYKPILNQKPLSLFKSSDVFFTNLLDIVLNNLFETNYPPDLIDNLTYYDIIELREKNKDKSEAFRTKYDNLLQLASKLSDIDDKETLISRIESISNNMFSLKEHFNSAVFDEIKSYRLFHSLKKSSTSVYNTLSLTMDFLGLFNLPISIINLVCNNCVLKKTTFVKSFNRKKISLQEKILRKHIEKHFHNDPIMVNYINELIKTHKENYLRPKL